jgi:hypothetical protein
MLLEADVQFVRHWVDTWTQRYPASGVAKPPPFDRETLGVPPAMWEGSPDALGWVGWRPIPSTATEADLEQIEAGLPGAYPPLFRAYLLTYCVMTIDTGEVRLVEVPSDDPLGLLREYVDEAPELVRAGYLPWGGDSGDAGDVYFDLARRAPDGDCPIVLFETDRIARQPLDELSPAWLRRIAAERYPSFRTFLDLQLARAP